MPFTLKNESLAHILHSYKSCIKDWVDYILNKAEYTPKGMIYALDDDEPWGTLRHASNLAHVCAQLTQLGLWEEECDAFVKSQGHNSILFLA